MSNQAKRTPPSDPHPTNPGAKPSQNGRPGPLEDVAVAIRYQFGAGGEAPRVIASGRGLLAKRIIEIARENAVPVSKEKVLAEALAQVPVGLEVPSELWEAMAEVLAHLYRLDGSLAK